MKKSSRIENIMAGFDAGPSGDGAAYDPRYVDWFKCFNAQEYYEAHDVLEHLWLKTRDANHAFFKGLIQVAGAFVHLRKHFERPHPRDVTRLRPAARLFDLGVKNLAPYGPSHLRLDVASICAMCETHAASIRASAFARNPWNPDNAPHIELAA